MSHPISDLIRSLDTLDSATLNALRKQGQASALMVFIATPEHYPAPLFILQNNKSSLLQREWTGKTEPVCQDCCSVYWMRQASRWNIAMFLIGGVLWIARNC